VLDRFASPEDMEKTGVKKERNNRGDELFTMKQTVRFIFKNRDGIRPKAPSLRTPSTSSRR
jgi:hypothetical protein